MKSITARAPAKLILSGEHSVVYGCPAIAFAVNRYFDTTITPHGMSSILFDLVNLPHKRARTINALSRIKNRLHRNYEQFLKGEKGIRDVLKKPFELLEYTASNFLDKIGHAHPNGFSINTQSNIPNGCGMGSSAALIVSTNFALSQYLKREVTSEDLRQLNIAAENLQHGKSSGLDIYISTHGGCHYFQQGQAESRPLPDFAMQVINTGTPLSSTGECVKKVAESLKSMELQQQFTAVTQSIDQALKNHDIEQLKQGIRQNHKLLCQIGVVPSKIENLIDTLYENGIVAKVCGAGAIVGDGAGMVLVLSDRDLNGLIAPFGYVAESIQAEANGVKIIEG
jgi:mevalonate kinase